MAPQVDEHHVEGGPARGSPPGVVEVRVHEARHRSQGRSVGGKLSRGLDRRRREVQSYNRGPALANFRLSEPK